MSRGYDKLTWQLISLGKIASRKQKNNVPVYEVPLFINKQRSVRVAVERHTKIRAVFFDPALQHFHVKRTAIEVDVSSVRLVSHDFRLDAKAREKIRGEIGRRSVGAINHELCFEAWRGIANACQMIQILLDEGPVRFQCASTRPAVLAQGAENRRFDALFFFIRQLVARRPRRP